MDLGKEIIKNPLVLDREVLLKALLSDLYQNDQAKVNLLLTAWRIGIVGWMKKELPLPASEKNRMMKLLTEQYSILDKRATWAVDTWMGAVTKDTLEALALALEKEAQEEMEAKLEQARLLPQDEDTEENSEKEALQSREDREDYYQNPTLTEEKNRIYIPSGVGKTDAGFFICGIKRADMCLSPEGDVFALVYNLLLRQTVILEEDIPRYIKKKQTTFSINYQTVFRLAMLLLSMIRHNYMKETTLTLAYQGDKEALKLAAGLINHYASLFSRLMHIEKVSLTLRLDPKGIPVSLTPGEGICIENNTTLATPARELWYGRKICYRLTKEDRGDLEYLLGEISPYDSFIDGQFDALCSMLGGEGHSVCIMPTGSGKSLIYYMISFLQPLPLLIVAPTDILIADQLRNLKNTHRIDNVAHLTLTEHNSFSEFDLRAGLNYITPMTLQNRHLLAKFRDINCGTRRLAGEMEKRLAKGPLFSYIVLDEIHCLSNWGHDFRPEYRMLSKFLSKYLDRVSLLGFTATANYTVVEDIQRQLSIPEHRFFSPISFERYNVAYHFRECATTEEMYTAVGEIAAALVAQDSRTVIFTKSDKISRRVADVVGWEADVYTADNPTAYHHFADGSCKVLVAGAELGVGINLPEVHHVIHFGLPLSKSEYVQEIGRAGRANQSASSHVIYLKEEGNVPPHLLERTTPITEIPLRIQGLDNDYAHIYRALTNNCPTKEVLSQRLIDFYSSLEAENRGLYLKSYPYESLEQAKQQIFMLYTVGYINDWYTYGESKNGEGVDVMIDVCSANTDAYRRDPGRMLLRMKHRLRDYFAFLDNDREGIAKTDRASDKEEVIGVFVEWYYKKYLYRHSEAFLDLLEFVKRHKNSPSRVVTAEIKAYFTLPFVKLKSDEAYYGEMSLTEIANKAKAGIDAATLANLERINSRNYSPRLDLLLFCGHLESEGRLEESRFDRILSRISEKERPTITSTLFGIYPLCPTEGKLALLEFIEKRGKSLGYSLEKFLTLAYQNGQKDLVYYGILAKHLNPHFPQYRR